MGMDPQVEVRIQSGTLVMKDGKAWGTVYQDAKCHSFGWIDPIYADLHGDDLKDPTHVTYTNSPYIKDLQSAKVVKVTKRTVVIIEESFPGAPEVGA